ncbi:MAG TPA: UDP-N-acetylmuramoyl-L-alanyl-D-glutamate--2,6-diaminopimelate ligase [Oligoflexus sp.]|uniref:UDP-N-acetylmuramoyl-L-alanyl-D-glutamate--2, 6-diaminopimelate ligase n=1 Tax=Oligoflexus sp. TaxID=1971216 RepID=UPI002D723A07|nr:UDP-N-acetylmuramoyl-L-alanyl-D-glutamate--2,6-diaminopimelate ligase [Oligoflexus sp.]HYX37425.1 UDP-N-acetylmuramoyl-L-alanyl-D-glutamate--2,6-diaminopimelate ligase [Oligoflexus sp.]
MLTRKLIAQDIVHVLQKSGLLLQHRIPRVDQPFDGHTTHSNRVQDGSLFIAYKGVSFDAHGAIPGLQEQFAGLGFIVEQQDAFEQMSDQTFVCLVKDSRDAWGWLAAHLYHNPQDQLRMIGITGTNGKTSTVWFLGQLLRTLGEPCLTMGTIGVYCGEEKFPATHTTPDPDELFRLLALAVEKGVTWAAMEVSSHAVVQRRLGPLRFDAAGFTSFSRDHLDFHKDMDEYFAAKWELFSHLLKPDAVAWLSHDLEGWLPPDAFTRGFHFYGTARQGRTLQTGDAIFEVASMTLQSTDLTVTSGSRRWQGRLPFGADFAMANFTAALLIVEGLLPGRTSAADWSRIEPVPGRFEPVPEAFAEGLAVIVDYAHTPDALDKTVHKLRELTKGQLWVVFGCGGDRDRGKRPLMGAVAEKEADVILVTSDNPRSEDPQAIIQDILGGMSQGKHKAIVDREAAILYAIQQAKSGDSILIAGKGHEDYQIIGKEKFPFDDRQVASRCLRTRPTK